MNSYKKWEEMEKYKEFKKENFEGAEKFSKWANKIWNFFSRFNVTFIVISVLAFIILIAIPYLISTWQRGIF